ncbi:MAG: PAS domain S-box protein [Methanobacteriaceae archaeon]|jgi:PAS domain S-box-containing protein|nr:PAS domain S-box protein [Methanobacteriaceae archaeon]
MAYQYSLFGAVLLMSAFIVLFLSVYSYKNRSSNLHKYFTLLMFFTFLWCFGSSMDAFSVEPWLKIFWVQIAYLGVTIVPPLWFILILSYGGYDKYLKPYFIMLLMILPLFILFLAFTYSQHQLIWTSITPVSNVPGALLVYEHGLFFWIDVIYSFLMSIMGITILLTVLNSSSRIYRPQIYMLIFSGITPIVFSLLYTTGSVQIPGLDVTPLGITISGIFIAIAIFKYDFLAIRPIIDEVLIKSMQNGLLVFDDKDTLMEVNKAANLIGVNEESIGKNFYDIFKDFPDIKSFYQGHQSESEIFLPYPWNLWIQLQITTIVDNESNMGKMLIIQDVTNRKMMEHQLSDSEERYKVLTDLSPDAILVIIGNKIVFANKSSYKLFGAKGPKEIIGQNILGFLHPEFKDICENRLYQVYIERKSLNFLEEKIISLDNQIKDIEIGDVPITYNNEPAVQLVIRDITERKKLEKRLKKSLDEKDLMMKEIHHRVKNNLMVIQSLLNLQSRYIKDPAVLNIFKESQNRAKSMALIHQRLYQSKDLKRIDFGEYAQALAIDLFNSYITDYNKINLDINVESVMLDINTSIPLGLILNEILSNSLKYAFPKDKKGNIKVEFLSKNSHYELIVSDNGIGLPADFDLEKSDSLGFKLIYGLSDQINAEVKVNKDNGTEIEIVFKEQPIVPE